MTKSNEEVIEAINQEYNTKHIKFSEDFEKRHVEELSKERACFEQTLHQKEKNLKTESTAKMELWVCIFQILR